MPKVYTQSSILIPFLILFLLFTTLAYSEQFVIVDRDNGDRLTGRLLSATDTHFEIEYNGQVLRFPLEGHTLRFTSQLDNVPDQVAAKHYRNGLDLLDLESPELAKRQFEKSLEEFPKYIDAHYQLGLLYNTEGNTEKALQRFRSVARIDPQKHDIVPILQEIGDNAETAEDYAQAVNAFQIILTYYPEHESIGKLTYHTGFLVIKHLDDPIAGLELLQKAVDEFTNYPEHEEAVYHIGVIQANSGEYENALYTLNQLIAIYQGSAWVDDAHLQRAIIFLKTGNTENAIEEAKRVRQNSNESSIIAQADAVLRASAWTIYTHHLPDPNIQAIAIDGTTLWIGTPNGIAQIETNGHGGWQAVEGAAWMINAKVQTPPDVRTIAVTKTGVWVGTRNQGIIHFNKITQKANIYPLPTGVLWIRDIKIDQTEIWCTTDNGIIQHNLDTGKQYHHQGIDIVPQNAHSIALTPDKVWVGTSGDDIAYFDRTQGTWEQQSFHEIKPEIQIVRFDVVGNHLFFSWYNDETKGNGIFQANWDGTNGIASSVDAGIEDLTKLDDILITGIVDYSEPNPRMVENGQVTPMPLVLWLAVKDYVAIDYTRTPQEWDGDIGYPTIVLEDSSLQCIAVDNNRAWIGTTKGMLTIDLQTIERQQFDKIEE